MITRVEGLTTVLALSVSNCPVLLFIPHSLFYALSSILQQCFLTFTLYSLFSSSVLLCCSALLCSTPFSMAFSPLFSPHLTSLLLSLALNKEHTISPHHTRIPFYSPISRTRTHTHIHTHAHIITPHPFHSHPSIPHLHLFILLQINHLSFLKVNFKFHSICFFI